jgi:hypothetical protein
MRSSIFIAARETTRVLRLVTICLLKKIAIALLRASFQGAGTPKAVSRTAAADAAPRPEIDLDVIDEQTVFPRFELLLDVRLSLPPS